LSCWVRSNAHRRLNEETPPTDPPSALASRLRLESSYPDRKLGREVPYSARRVPLGFLLMWIAGVVSGLLGIGSGVLKVLAMDGAMRLPMKVSSATSNFMIGVTAAASAGIYLGRGDVDPRIAGPVALGVLGRGDRRGAAAPAHLQPNGRLIFLPVLVVVGWRPSAAAWGLDYEPGSLPSDGQPRPDGWSRHQRGLHRGGLRGGAGGRLAGIADRRALRRQAPGSHNGLLEPAGSAGTLEPLAVSQLGLLILLATPGARVAASVVGFALERDRLYTAITLAVLPSCC
jgi:hypothetical protein